ncbi:tail completion protein gp17 [Candidatus Finniella inopinata]|uniref:DUF3168 domain-containing protein n=1 Tax=Candidatus Finniella inopinata TaxID=1696036 RepID=A0A4Q7DIL8_9PROT|nr:hypothetical protein [Candidatus Finniella inopinata]RZI46572.1 hypothetical protein EQU50_03010 [Candidatus Finniella inopinata]
MRDFGINLGSNLVADFGVLNAVRQLLAMQEDVRVAGASENIHMAVPPSMGLPLIVLELEEVWTSMALGKNSANTRLKVKASIFSRSPSGRESMDLSASVRQAMDGTVLSLKNGKKGMLRLAENVVERPAANRPRNVQQYYDVLIRV